MAKTFVELADTLVAGFDVVDFLHVLARRSVELLNVDAAGILLADHRDRLRFIAASTEQARFLEILQLQDQEGPCMDAYRLGEQVSCDDITGSAQRWPRFSEAALREGFSSVNGLPLRLRDETVGALNLLRRSPGPLDPGDIALGQGLADVATVGIVNSRSVRERDMLAEQLQSALNSRIVIEQAKGVLSERRGVGMDEAFELLRSFARTNNRRLSEVARGVVRREPDVGELVGARPGTGLG
ncbi:GAF and ANTAR domain-containing protein [Nocardiopsis sediminis]|uniref:GAF and ANTAR domain-containing protein n=1 Tax=Nocardiopsis sediminis TaxID=1778267 RepID=A0ABV8FPL6_9ACTN